MLRNRASFSLSTLLVVVVVVAALPVSGQSDRPDPLAGVSDLQVVVAALSAAGRNAELTEDQIRTDVELTLRQSGITIKKRLAPADFDPSQYPTFDAAVDSLGSENWLYVNVNVVPWPASPGYIYAVTVEFYQPVRLQRHAKLDDRTLDWTYPASSDSFDASTWSQGALAATPQDGSSRRIRDAVTDIAKEFANDYLAANPVRR